MVEMHLLSEFHKSTFIVNLRNDVFTSLQVFQNKISPLGVGISANKGKYQSEKLEESIFNLLVFRKLRRFPCQILMWAVISREIIPHHSGQGESIWLNKILTVTIFSWQM